MEPAAIPERQSDAPPLSLVAPSPDPYGHRSRRGLTHLLDTEDVIHQRLTQLPCSNKEAAELARALCATRQAIRREQMKPDPKPVEVKAIESRSKSLVVQDAEFSEPAAPAEASS